MEANAALQEVQDYWGMAWLGPRRYKRFMAAVWQLRQAMTELAIVGNPGPVQAGERWYGALIEGIPRWKRGRLVISHDALVLSWAQQEDFVAAVRLDLHYLPRGWQVWRLAWWSVRVKTWRQKRASRTSRGKTGAESAP